MNSNSEILKKNKKLQTFFNLFYLIFFIAIILLSGCAAKKNINNLKDAAIANKLNSKN